ncbi:flagellar basal-body MS-ring/collar protein FliF [Entomohabitans teleogrylli]|uniref:flagellar basal-body MS-ring/collar protein FliF n=1 Tax=Entomohabitans teleogrylli TaxID=1384589 RepID=UPI00073D887D|nr:flagellar basal-body MS-ring/collar protein FliF [Entomohabitans teleogrylli]
MHATTNASKNNIATLMTALERLRAHPKLVLLVSAAAALSAIIALTLWATAPAYRVLYSNISDRDGGAIVAQLTQMNIPYRFSDRGGAIMVPADQVHDARLKLAQQGLPKGGSVGFELLDQEKFGISQFSEQVNYQRALEGELSRTIESLGPLQSARVHLAIPRPSLFVREQKQPTASVTVNLHPGRMLEPGQVSAIGYLIASAVPGLSAESVTVVDQSGRLLTQNGAGQLHSSQLKYTAEVETDYQQRIHAILAPLVGSRNVRAQVTAQLDFTSHEQTAEQYQPNNAPEKRAIRSRQSSDAQQGGSSGVGGVPGALSNQPPTPAAAPLTQPITASQGTAAGDKSTALTPINSSKDETVNYELDRTLTHIRRGGGTIERLSVAVVINHLPGKEGVDEALSQQQMAQIDALVKEAVGYSAARGDTVNVVNSPFSSADKEADIPLWRQPDVIDLLMAAVRYLLIGIVAWVLWRKAVQPSWLRHQELALQRLELEKEARQAELDALVREKESGARVKAQQRVDAELHTQQLREMAEQDPQVIALVLRQWMNKEHAQ